MTPFLRKTRKKIIVGNPPCGVAGKPMKPFSWSCYCLESE